MLVLFGPPETPAQLHVGGGVEDDRQLGVVGDEIGRGTHGHEHTALGLIGGAGLAGGGHGAHIGDAVEGIAPTLDGFFLDGAVEDMKVAVDQHLPAHDQFHAIVSGHGGKGRIGAGGGLFGQPHHPAHLPGGGGREGLEIGGGGRFLHGQGPGWGAGESREAGGGEDGEEGLGQGGEMGTAEVLEDGHRSGG